MKNASEKAEAVKKILTKRAAKFHHTENSGAHTFSIVKPESTTWLWIAADGSVRWGTPDKNIMKALTAALS
jgi:hypothetical protein